MTKELFVEAIEAIEKQYTADCRHASYLCDAFPNVGINDVMPDNSCLTNALIHVLQAEMNDLEVCEYGQSWIEYFCYELDFGNLNDRLKVTVNDKEVKMSNAGELYCFLESRNVK
jgi:hypothetical protein